MSIGGSVYHGRCENEHCPIGLLGGFYIVYMEENTVAMRSGGSEAAELQGCVQINLETGGIDCRV